MFRVFVILLGVVISCSAQVSDEFTSYLKELSADFSIEQIEPDSLDTRAAILLDTREKEEFDISHLESAIWIGYDDFDLSRLDSLDREKNIVVYCSVGYRSSKIGVLLKENGFENVKNLYGGIFNWANRGHPLFNDNSRTNQIHTYNKYWGRFLQNPALTKID